MVLTIQVQTIKHQLVLFAMWVADDVAMVHSQQLWLLLTNKLNGLGTGYTPE